MKVIRRNPIFSLFFLFCLILLNGIGATLPIPNLTQLSEYYHFPIGFIEAIFVGISTCFLFFWGVVVDKMERKNIIWIANVIWIIPSFIIFFFPQYLIIYIIGRIGMAIGLAAFSPLAYSILADYSKYDDRGLIASGLNLAWVGSSALGILIGGFFSDSWHLAFGFISMIGGIILVWEYFIKIPQRGVQEPALVSMEEFRYPYRIELRHIPRALSSKTIILLLVQGSFALVPGTFFTYWLVSFLSSSEGINASTGIASVVSIIIASGRAIGYPAFGKLGDFYTRKTEDPVNRAKIASLGMGSQAIFFFIAFSVMDSTISSFILFASFFWFGSLIGAASGPNRTSLLYEISLPEHRGTLGSLFSLTDQLGVVFGIILSTILIQFSGFRTAFVFSVSFYLVASVVWALSTLYIKEERTKINVILSKRMKHLIKCHLMSFFCLCVIFWPKIVPNFS
ncbi:MAG: MFS transporter [Candidatus Hodarchaeales archaeon]|jgi:MFS family permease